MKAAFCLLSVGVLAQASIFRPVDLIPIEPSPEASIGQIDLFSLGSIGKDLSNVGNQITKTANQVGNQITQGATDIGDTVANEFATGALAQAVTDWGQVNWQNGDGLVAAIQVTAQGMHTYYNDLNTLTGGQLNSQDLAAAATVADMVFPPAAIIIDAGEITLNIGADAVDITNLCLGINSGIQSKNYVQVAIDAFQLFEIIAEASA